jgi:hypothetical protein
MTEYNRVRDNLKTLTVDDVSTTQIFDASKVIFLSKEALPDAQNNIDVVEFYRSVHAITYGNTIPNTGVQVEGLSDGDGIEPTLNECISILAVSLGNTGGAPIEVSVKLGDLPLIVTAVAPGGTTTSSELGAIFPISLSKGNALKFEVVTGTGSDLNAIVQYNKTVQ